MAGPSQHSERIQTICLLVLTAVAVSVALYYLKAVVVPFLLAVFLMYCLTPFINAQMRWFRLPRGIAVATTIILGCLLLLLVGLLITAAVGQLTDRADEYQGQVDQLLHRIASSPLLERLGIEKDDLSNMVFRIPSAAVGTLLKSTVTGVMGVLANSMLVVIFMVFLVMGRTTSSAGGLSTLREIESRTQRYIVTMVLISGVLGFLVGITLALLGVRFALMFGFLAFLFNFIPNIGPIMATILPVPVVLLSPELSIVSMVLAIAIPGAIQFTIGNYFQPKLTGQSLDLHPVAVLLALIFFGLLWGIVGMFLATPLTAVVKILLEKLDYTRPIARLLAGQIDREAPKASRSR